MPAVHGHLSSPIFPLGFLADFHAHHSAGWGIEGSHCPLNLCPDTASGWESVKVFIFASTHRDLASLFVLHFTNWTKNSFLHSFTNSSTVIVKRGPSCLLFPRSNSAFGARPASTAAQLLYLVEDLCCSARLPIPSFSNSPSSEGDFMPQLKTFHTCQISQPLHLFSYRCDSRDSILAPLFFFL